MANDRIAALDEIRELVAAREALIVRMDTAGVNVVEFNATQDGLADRVPSLLAALDAVLKLADEWDAEAGRLRALVNEDTEANTPTQAARSLIASTRWDSARLAREAITRELTGEETPSGPGED